MSFKKFVVENTPPVQEVPSNDTPVAQPSQRWDVVLFAGDYNPITREEYTRVRQFVNTFLKDPANSPKFNKKVDIGLLIDYEEKKDNILSNKENYILSLEERNFISTSMFGLKIYPVKFDEMVYLLKSSKEDFSAKQELVNKVNEMVFKLKDDFYSSNVLIVLRPEHAKDLGDLKEIVALARGGMNIGFVVFEHEPLETSDIFSTTIPMTGDIIKAICILDRDRPNPEYLKAFAHKYKLSHVFEAIKRIHFKVDNEKYILAFRLVFPDISIFSADDTAAEANSRVMLELLKNMYLKNDE
jgi:hypothetical protein